MKLDKFLKIAVPSLLISSIAFDILFAENAFPDQDIKVSPHFRRVVASGETRFYIPEGLSCRDMLDKLKKDQINPNHRLTITDDDDDIDLQFKLKAVNKDPVIFFLSNKGEAYCIQRQYNEYENFHSTSVIIKNYLPKGTYLIWVGNIYSEDKINYKLTIEEDEQ